MRIFLLLTAVLFLQDDPVRRYGKADFGQKKGTFDDGCRERILTEFAIIQAGKPGPLRKALSSSNRDVRAFAASALGILKDRKSVGAVSKLAADDPDPLVRIMALQSLGWMKDGARVIKAGRKDRNRDVRFVAKLAEGHLSDRFDYAKQVRNAYKVGIKKSEMATAVVGKPAPDFTATTMAGRKFKLSSVLKKKVVILLFQLADW